MTEKASAFACVKCGDPATEGSMQHPYCTKCWDQTWKGREAEYQDFLAGHRVSEQERTLAG